MKLKKLDSHDSLEVYGAEIELQNDQTLLNTANHGKSPLDPSDGWDHDNVSIDLRAGDKVYYTVTNYVSGKVHEITKIVDEITYEKKI